MISFIKKKHLGIILAPSKTGFDSGASTFICAFTDVEDPNVTYLYYTGAKDRNWSHAAIGLAVSDNNYRFRKIKDLNPLIDGRNSQFNSKESVTPAVVRLGNYYYMFFAGSATSRLLPYKRKIGVAYAGDPRGPWEVLKVIAKPKKYWEGWSIDLGPAIVKLSERDILLFYSNVTNKKPFDFFFGPRYWRRYIGILKVNIKTPRSINASKYELNPLSVFNGPKGTPHESLFCPGYFSKNQRHYLIPSMSTYSGGFPYRQYIGIISDENPFFENSKGVSILIDGPKEKKLIIPEIKSEIALDTPSTMIKEEKIYLYYSVMDRHDRIWKTALTLIHK